MRHVEGKRLAEAVGVIFKIPRHERLDVTHGPVGGEACEGLRQPRQRIDLVHFGGLNER